jgi:hypothetical protein
MNTIRKSMVILRILCVILIIVLFLWERITESGGGGYMDKKRDPGVVRSESVESGESSRKDSPTTGSYHADGPVVEILSAVKRVRENRLDPVDPEDMDIFGEPNIDYLGGLDA